MPFSTYKTSASGIKRPTTAALFITYTLEIYAASILSAILVVVETIAGMKKPRKLLRAMLASKMAYMDHEP